jgi:hypothetical protein
MTEITRQIPSRDNQIIKREREGGATGSTPRAKVALLMPPPDKDIALSRPHKVPKSLVRSTSGLRNSAPVSRSRPN